MCVYLLLRYWWICAAGREVDFGLRGIAIQVKVSWSLKRSIEEKKKMRRVLVEELKSWRLEELKN